MNDADPSEVQFTKSTYELDKLEEAARALDPEAWTTSHDSDVRAHRAQRRFVARSLAAMQLARQSNEDPTIVPPDTVAGAIRLTDPSEPRQIFVLIGEDVPAGNPSEGGADHDFTGNPR